MAVASKLNGQQAVTHLALLAMEGDDGVGGPLPVCARITRIASGVPPVVTRITFPHHVSCPPHKLPFVW